MKKLFTVLFAGIMTVCSSWAAAIYDIYPIPHSVTMGTASCDISSTVNIQADATIDAATLQRAKNVLEAAGYTVTTETEAKEGITQLLITTAYSSGDVATKIKNDFAFNQTQMMKKEKYDRHALIVSEKGIAIVGEDTNAAFYALASLEQMLEQRNADGSLTATTIYDYADQKNRGLVEGYYGYPYSVDVKKDLMHFMMRYKMNTYLYGAKSDPYHSQYWKNPYPTSITNEQKKNGWLSQAMVKDLAKTSAETKVNFIWAIHPGNSFLGSTTVIDDIMGKFTDMHKLGVRQFAVFVDDVGIPSTQADMTLNATRLTNLQKAMEAKWNTSSALATDTVRPLHFVPQIYCSGFASSAEQRQNFMAALGKTPDYITIYTTGQGVWTVPNSGHMQNMNNELGRDMAWWWNYPCNDNADGQIYPMDMYSNFRDMPAVDGNAKMPTSLTNTIGLVANPMQQGEVAKTPLFSVADYAWNNSAFDNLKSWEASFKPLISNGEVREAYRFITSYLRWNEPSSVKTIIDAYKKTLSTGNPNSTDLNSLLNKIIENCSIVEKLADSDSESDRLLYTDLRPWLLKLKKDCQTINQLLLVADNTDAPEERWEKYIEGLNDISELSTSTDYTAYALEGMGSGISVSKRQAQLSQLYLEPFISYIKENAYHGYFVNQTSGTKATGITNHPSLSPSVSTSGNVVSMIIPARAYSKGQYVGIQLPQATILDSIFVADTLAAKHHVLYSSNGKEWTRYNVADKAPNTPVRFFIVSNAEDAISSFRISSVSIKLFMPKKTAISSVTIPTDTEVWQGHVKDYIADGDYTTFCTLNRNQKTDDMYVIDLGTIETIHDVRICMGTTNGDYMTEGRVQVSEDGNKWSSLRVKGVTTTYRYALDMPQNVKYSNDMTYCDFDGRQLKARYVRLRITSPNTSKWLRLYEMEVNKSYYESRLRQLCVDGSNQNQPYAIDGDGSTCISTDMTGPLTYYLESIRPVTNVCIYSNPSSMGSELPTVEALNLDGTTTYLGTLNKAVQDFDLSSCSDAIAVRVLYKGSAPAIHEIVPTYENDTFNSIFTAVTGIESDGRQNSPKLYDLQGRPLWQTPKRGIYIRGKKVVAK